jgi:hypothetical protein
MVSRYGADWTAKGPKISCLQWGCQLPTNDLQSELDRRAARGQLPTTIRELSRRLSQLGYKLNRDGDCKGAPRWMTGDAAGSSYPGVSLDVVEADTGIGFANVNARRDSNFKELQRIRYTGELFAIVRGRILEI